MFRKLAQMCSDFIGRPSAFVLAVVIVIIWGVTGPLFNYSDTWQLVINTGTTIITFLMVFLVQNTQNRDAKAIHLKIDEIIRSIKGARNDMLDLEDEPDQRLKDLHQEFQELSRQTRDLAEIHKDELKKSK
jgi:low affinity Fe/Cu permease